MHGDIYIFIIKKEETGMPYIHALLHDDKKGGGELGRCWFDNEYLMGEKQRMGKHSKEIFTIFIELIIIGYEINLKVAVDLFLNTRFLT